MSKDLVLFGAGGSGREIARLVEKINDEENTFNLLGFVDDNESLWGQNLNGIPVLGGTEWLLNFKDKVLCSVTSGIVKIREAICSKLIAQDVKFATLIDPSASIGKTVQIGEGCIINENCELTVNINVGNFVYLNSDVCLGHDDNVGDYSILNPHVQVSGACSIGRGVTIGGMSFLSPKVKIGDYAVVAPGSIVYGRVKDNAHVMGNPARRIGL